MTGIAAANADGDKLLTFLIEKSKNPQCFKNAKLLLMQIIPCSYRSQRNGWMDNVLFEEWVRALDSKFLK